MRFDAGSGLTWEYCPDGSLRVRGTIALANVWLDYGDRKEFVEPSALFDPDYLDSCMGALTLEHPPMPIDTSNWRQFSVGHAFKVIAIKSQNKLDAVFTVSAADAIAAIRSGKVELSCGYNAECEYISPQRYRQVRRINNHVALCDRARAGRMARLAI